MVKTMSEEAARELLRRGRMGRLGCIADDAPYVVPVNYNFDGESALIHSLPGKKINAMRERPRVCLQVDEIEGEFKWRSVLAFGEYEEITNAAERARVINHLLADFPQLTPVESRIAEDAGAPSPVVFRVRVARLSGVYEG